MSISYIEEHTTVIKELDFEPENYIYLQKLAKEQGKSVNEIVNNIIKEHALNTFKNEPPLIRYIPVTQPDTPPWYKYNITCGTVSYPDTSKYSTTYTPAFSGSDNIKLKRKSNLTDADTLETMKHH